MRLVKIVFLLTCFQSLAFPSWAQTSASTVTAMNTKPASTTHTPLPSTAEAVGEADDTARANAWTVGLMGGLLEGAPIRFAADIQAVLDDGDNLRVIPMLGRGANQNILDILHLKGVDVAIVYTDGFDAIKKEGKINNIDKRINYISQLYIGAFHLLVRPEIKTIKDLEGKKVGFQGNMTAVANTSRIVFERLGVNPDPVYFNNTIALEKMKNGEVAGLVYMVSKGHPTMTAIDAKFGFHLLPVEYEKFTDYYIPTTFEHDDYPNLIQNQERIEVIGVPTVLAVYNWAPGTDRYRKVERFIQHYFDRFEQLKKPPFQPQWKEINLRAEVPGWTRYSVAAEMLSKLKNPGATTKNSTLPDSAEFQEFLEWKKKNK